MRRDIGQEKLLNVNSFTSKKLIMEKSIRRIRENQHRTLGWCHSRSGYLAFGDSRGDGHPVEQVGVKSDIAILEVSDGAGMATGADLPALGADGLQEGPGKPLGSLICVVLSHYLLCSLFLVQTARGDGEGHQGCRKMLVVTASIIFQKQPQVMPHTPNPTKKAPSPKL